MRAPGTPAESAAPRTAIAAAPPWPRRWNLALLLIFLGALMAPNMDLVFHLDPRPSPVREVVTFPRFRLDRSLLRFPGELLWYLKSSMGFRGTLVRTRGLLAWRGLGVSSAPESVIRADPWLFLRDEHVVEDFRRVDPFSARQLDAWRAVLEQRAAWLARRGIRYLIVIAPNKETVYAEFVPASFARAPGPSRLTQLRDHLATTTRLDFVDLTDALMARKADGRLFHFTDTHWNDRGAFVAYQAIVNRLRPWFPELRGLELRELTIAPRVTPGGDLARMAGLKNDLPEPQEQLVLSPALARVTLADGSPVTFDRIDVGGVGRFETRAPSGEVASATIVRDSFGEGLIPYLSRHFQSATWIWTYDFPAELIERQRPRVVIEELVERKLMVLAPKNPF
jgi:alginate O-acetyltransferase complex protein AlgJ